MDCLLAKSVKPGQNDKKTLPGHTIDVLDSTKALFGRKEAPTRLALAWLQFFGLDESAFGRLLNHLRVAAAFHDLGKANDGFQDLVLHNGPQVIRHEHLSGLLMADRDLAQWLGPLGLDAGIILAAVLSHHVKVGYKTLGKPEGVRSVVRVLSDHKDFGAVWETIQTVVGAACPVKKVFPRRWTAAEIRQRSDALKSALQVERSRLREDPQRRRLLHAVRAGLIVADAVGSAVLRMDKKLEDWVKDSFPEILTGDDIREKIIDRRIAQLRSEGRWDEDKGFSDFQRGIAGQGPRVLLTTPCGSGKTLAAWNWIEARLRDSPAARVLFLYPTRATATEGFRDYVSWAPEDEAGLLSGTADYDLQEMFANPDDARHHRDYRADPRLYALGHWRKRIFSATADQFFPFLQYSYGPLCMLPLLAESVLVVDEVHSFDRSMFATLKRFLKEFPTIPVLCMTATLPVKRREDLTDECGLRPYPEVAPADLAVIAGHPRYRIEWIDRDRAKAVANAALRERCRVLWVVNRVRDCQATFVDFREDAPEALVYCYHSRFRLKDRRDRHNGLIRTFQDAARDSVPSRAILGVTTQVCEMSLDLDADVLVTEVAPIASLIQRMGRCNRDHRKMADGRIGHVYVLRPAPGNEKPYDKTDLDAAVKFVDSLVGREVSQAELEDAFEIHDPQVVEPDRHCPFLDSGPYAESGEESFREAEEFTVPCVLDEDLPTVLEAIRGRQTWDGLVVPVPKRLADESKRPQDARFPRWLSVAPAAHYHTSYGFGDNPRPDVKEGPAS